MDQTIDKGKWQNILGTHNQSPNLLRSQIINYPNIWQPFPSDKVPKNFSYGSIYHYLVTSCIDDNNSDSDIENHNPKADYSTSKPLKRGKQYVDSGHVFEILEGVTSDQMFCLKCKIQASYKAKEVHQVSVMINPSTTRVIHGTCDCKASSMGRCSHVAALLYVLLNYLDACDEDNVPCTSKLCSWNQGRKRKEPHKADEQQYKNKNDISKRRSYDPGRSLTRPVDKQKINNLLSDLQLINASRKAPTMWQLLLQPQYEDYILDKPRKSQLKTLVYRLTTNVCNNRIGPVDITLGVQSDDDKWWQYRKILITASKIKQFKTDKTNDQIFALVNSQLWVQQNITTEAMQYGRENEEIARQKYKDFTSKKFSYEVQSSGLWVNSKYPGLGASPDGLILDPLRNTTGVLEIKCPKILENFNPTDLHFLTPQQRTSFCCTSVSTTCMKLKRNHPYYYQIQTQMAITERLWCDFVIWTSKGFHVEKIYYDGTFIEPILKHVSAFHQNILAPEYFEMRIPRRLIPFDLSK